MDSTASMDLKIKEAFISLEGETVTTGFPALFIRFAGCNLRCTWCDTPHSWEGGLDVSLEGLVRMVQEHRWVHHVTVTGGEPLLQAGVVSLLQGILDMGMRVQMETNGSMPLSLVPAGVRKIVDVKPPSSGHEDSFSLQNLSFMNEHDELKCAVATSEDLNYASSFLREHWSSIRSMVSLSPVSGSDMMLTAVADFILSTQVNMRLNLQAHKLIWQDGEPEGRQISLENYR